MRKSSFIFFPIKTKNVPYRNGIYHKKKKRKKNQRSYYLTSCQRLKCNRQTDTCNEEKNKNGFFHIKRNDFYNDNRLKYCIPSIIYYLFSIFPSSFFILIQTIKKKCFLISKFIYKKEEKNQETHLFVYLVVDV
jgi:hypothetical protein